MLKFHIPHHKDGEKIILLLRRHIFIILYKIAFWGLVAILPPIFYLIFRNVLASLFFNELFSPIIVLFTSIFYLYIWLFAFHSFVDYYLDVWIVTDERIVNIEQKGLFARTVSEQKLYRVQDVTSELKGPFSTLLDFGTVYIQTAGEHARFVFKQVPNPYQVARKITKIAEQNKKFHQLMEKKDKITTKK
jgi:membrane protein YdbS with pleckstrin-like domain